MNFPGAPADKTGGGLYPAGYPNYAPTQPGMAHTLATAAAPATHRQLAAQQPYPQSAMPQNVNPSVYTPTTGVYSTLSPGYPTASTGAFHPPTHPHAMQYATFQSPSGYPASQYAPTYIGAPQLGAAGAAYPMGIAVSNPHGAPTAYNPSVGSVPRAYTSQTAMSQAAMSQAAMSQAAMSQMGYNPLGSNVPTYPGSYGFNGGYP